MNMEKELSTDTATLRIEVRFKNAALLKALERQYGCLRKIAYHNNGGIISLAARAMGVNGDTLIAYANLSLSPYHLKDGSLSPVAVKVAEDLDMPVEQVFPLELYQTRFPKLQRDVAPAEILSLSAPELRQLAAPVDTNRQALLESINEVLYTLSPREEMIIKRRFGLDGYEPTTLEDIGKRFKTSGENVRRIEAKALRKLRHPTRSEPLKAAVIESKVETSSLVPLVH